LKQLRISYLPCLVHTPLRRYNFFKNVTPKSGFSLLTHPSPRSPREDFYLSFGGASSNYWTPLTGSFVFFGTFSHSGRIQPASRLQVLFSFLLRSIRYVGIFSLPTPDTPLVSFFLRGRKMQFSVDFNAPATFWPLLGDTPPFVI